MIISNLSKGSVVILKNNRPSYIVLDFKKLQELQVSEKDSIGKLDSRVLSDNIEAFKELAK